MCEGKRVFSPFEVSKHSTQNDCWVIIHGRVYDVTDYIPRHPGGALIYVKAGGDCSQLFDSYHTTPRARCCEPFMQHYRAGAEYT
jgi:cytochrome b involved in lipid metabolism